MIQGNNLVLDQWIDKEFPVLAKLADGEDYDDLHWNNLWLKSEEDEQRPPLSPERKEEIREKARQVRNKKDDEIDNLQKAIDSIEVKYIELIKENSELKDTINKQHDRITSLEGLLKNLKDQPKEKLDKLTKRIKDLEDRLQKSKNSDVKTADCDTGVILMMKDEIEKNKKEITKLKKTLEDKIQKVSQQTDSFIKKQIDDLKECVTDQLTEQSSSIDKATTHKLSQAVNEHITNTTRIIEEKVDEAVSKADTSNVPIWGVDTDSEHDFEHLDIQKKMTMDPKKPFESYSERITNKKEPPVHIQDNIEHLIIGDSIIQGINENKFHKNFGTKVVPLRGKGIIEVCEYLDQVIFKRGNPKNIIIHTGSNDINKLTIDEMENRFEELIEFVKNKFGASKIIISMVIDRFGNDEFKQKVQSFNTVLKDICKRLKVQYVFHNDINKNQECYRDDNIHLSNAGTSIFVKNLKELLRRNHSNQTQGKQTFNFRSNNDNMKNLIKGMFETFVKMM